MVRGRRRAPVSSGSDTGLILIDAPNAHVIHELIQDAGRWRREAPKHL